MPTTIYEDFTAGLREVPNRTDAAGEDVVDLPLREDALINSILTQGALSGDAFEVTTDAPGDMELRVGSGTAGADIYVVESTAQGQPPYLVQLQDSHVDVTVPAADASARVDEVYLVVADSGVDSTDRRMARLAYRQGDPGSGSPGPDSDWANYALLATVDVGGGATEITSGDLTDERATAQIRPPSQAHGFEVFTTDGTFTVPQGIQAIRVTAIGGGGAGGGAPSTDSAQASAGSGGGAGEMAQSWLAAADLDTTEPITVGQGGQGASAADGGDGGQSSFGSHVIANGGNGGVVGFDEDWSKWVRPGGSGGTGGVGDLVVTGNDGHASRVMPVYDGQISNTHCVMEPRGGASSLGGSPQTLTSTSETPGTGGRAGQGPGAGGSGAVNEGGVTSDEPGGDGADGIVIVEW